NRVDTQRRLADADRYALAVLAAHADAGVQRQVVADHGYAVQYVGAVADQRRALDWRADFAIFDAVGLGGREHEIAGSDVDRAAGKVDGVNAVVDGGDDGFGGVLAGAHVGVGHARHDGVGIGFAPRVAGRRHAHQPRVVLVLHVTDQRAVLDQRVAGGGRAFVIHGQRAAALFDGAVIDHGAQFGGDL